ncbi:PLDc N-terminal domain-containing protein [Microbacterium sp. SD291]|uniref:PLDc N-terminal domain-containing protein n=1 Tax=Microbacterium sp. SD291 TaxID=2782007 RepID=UPI001A95A02A|nr:PLD nuclease N-terminal domain-containing protein [Microbacterium sp. SD291]MBO0981661.1 PLDc_N domain-containing protein [Microbacterium sp. SD291]
MPSPLDIAISMIAIGALAYSISAIVDLVRLRHARGVRFLAWILIVILLPVAGASIWWFWGRSASECGAADI